MEDNSIWYDDPDKRDEHYRVSVQTIRDLESELRVAKRERDAARRAALAWKRSAKMWRYSARSGRFVWSGLQYGYEMAREMGYEPK